jgi:RNA polymerase sigma factor (sigma-70 family)
MEAAREVINDIFIQVWNRRGSLTHPIHSYLLRSTQNGAIDHLRARRSRHRTLRGHREQLESSYQEQYILSTPEPLQYVELRSAEEEIRKAIDRLPPRSREIFKAWFDEGRSAEDIAEAMDIRVSTVRVQLKTAFDRLREMLKHLL